MACGSCLFDYFEGERTKNEGLPYVMLCAYVISTLTTHSQPRHIQQARQRCQRANAKARSRNDTASRTYVESGQPDHTFQGPCPVSLVFVPGVYSHYRRFVERNSWADGAKLSYPSIFALLIRSIDFLGFS